MHTMYLNEYILLKQWIKMSWVGSAGLEYIWKPIDKCCRQIAFVNDQVKDSRCTRGIKNALNVKSRLLKL